jgi:TolB protein
MMPAKIVFFTLLIFSSLQLLPSGYAQQSRAAGKAVKKPVNKPVNKAVKQADKKKADIKENKEEKKDPIINAQGPADQTQQPKTDDKEITITGGELILAVADAQPASPDKSGEFANAQKTFNQILWDDLSYSGFFTMAGRSFYPPQPIIHPEADINYDSWKSIPFKVSFLTVGTLNLSNGVLRCELSVYDMRKQLKRAFGKEYIGAPDQIRTIAHMWADTIVFNLTAGASKGIASTKIAYVSRKGNAKEIHIMDYDGSDQQEFTHSGSLNLFPTWAPDNSKLAFVSFRPKPEISIFSYIDGSRLPFPIYDSFASTPAISPNGKEVAFALRTPRGDADLFISKLDGSDRRNITNNPFIDSSPTWSPSGSQLAFTSNREGKSNQIFICDADGSNVRRIVKEGGDADSPAWSPNGKWIAFQWKPHLGNNHDIFMTEAATGVIYQLTSNHGSNENPSWAPDGRHLTFQSNRSGSSQIYIMIIPRDRDTPSEPRRITNQGNNSSPAWSGYFSKGPGN